MKVDEHEMIATFETMPSEGVLYLTAVKYQGGYWCAGPGGMSKEETLKMLQSYSGVEAVRIYPVRVPLAPKPAV